MVGTVLVVGEFRERALGNSERELENTVLLLARHFDQQLDDVEVPLNDIIAQMHQAGMASPDDFQAPDVHSGNAPVDEGQGQRAFGNRRHQRL